MKQLNLKELREKYPKIKSTSRLGFMKKLREARGLGDTIEAITEATGVKKAVEWLMDGKDCNCQKRKEILNKVFRYSNCLVESEYIWWTEYLKRHDPKYFSKQDVWEIERLHRRVFRVRISICKNCNGATKVMNKLVDNINILYETYR